eukprot:9256842-Alexandrium_andersonii.AAC.1
MLGAFPCLRAVFIWVVALTVERVVGDGVGSGLVQRTGMIPTGSGGRTPSSSTPMTRSGGASARLLIEFSQELLGVGEAAVSSSV